MVLCNNYVSAEDSNGNPLPMLVRFYAYYRRDSSWVKLGLLSIQPGVPTKIALTQGTRHLFVPIVEEGYEVPAEIEITACTTDVVFVYNKIVEEVDKNAIFKVKDADGVGVQGVEILVGGPYNPLSSIYTDASGQASIILQTNQWCTANCYPTDEWGCVDCYQKWYHTDNYYNEFTIKESEPEMCRLDFLVFDTDWVPMYNVTCRVGGKEATTHNAGACSIEVECGKTYTARCDIPDGYTCACDSCCCEDGPFLVTGNHPVKTFFLKKVTEPEEHCQQDFKVVDQNGDPVEKVILGGEDQSDFVSFDIKGHAGIGTLRDGTISTLQTIGGRSYKFYISEFPPGYEIDTIDGISVVGPLNACTDEILFRVKNLSAVPDACSVNVCVQNQFGSQLTGIAISITDVGTVYTKEKLEMFGCTGEIGLVCGQSITVSATVPDGFEGIETSKTFVTDGKQTIILKLKDLSPDPDKVKLLIDVPSFVMAGNVEISGTGPANERVYIMGEKSWIGFDWVARDTELGDTIIGSDGKFAAEIELNEFGSVNIYAKVKKGGFWDWIVADLYSTKHTIWVLTETVVIVMLLAVALVLEKKYNKLGLFRGGNK